MKHPGLSRIVVAVWLVFLCWSGGVGASPPAGPSDLAAEVKALARQVAEQQQKPALEKLAQAIKNYKTFTPIETRNPKIENPFWTLREILTELLATGVLLGESGRERELFLTARKYEPQLADYLAPLSLNLVPDPDRPLLQARPIPGECGLTARFTKDETLVVLTL